RRQRERQRDQCRHPGLGRCADRAVPPNRGVTRHDFGQISAGSKPVPYWEPTREWDGETCFILCGGPSAAAHDIGRLRGHKLIAVNSSIFTAPWANFLLFGDTRWWDEYERDAELKRILQNDALRVVSCSSIVRH